MVINNEKYLTLNLSMEPKFIFTFLVTSYTTFIRPNFIGKVAQKTTSLLQGHDFRTKHQVLTSLSQCHNFDTIDL